MSKRQMQEAKLGEEERVVAESKPTLSLVSRSVDRSPTLDSDVSYSPENGEMQSRNSDHSGIENSIARNVNENAASSSHVWHRNENTRSGIEKSIAMADERSGIKRSIAKIQNRLTETRSTHHNFEIFNFPYSESLRQCTTKVEPPGEGRSLDLEVNVIIWVILMSATTMAAVQLGLDCEKNLSTTKNTDFEQHYAKFNPGTRK